MEKIEFHICSKEYYFKDILVFRATKDIADARRNEIFIKTIRHPNSYSSKDYKHLSNEELLEGMVIKELPKPNSFPKFSNEQDFQIEFNGKTIKNPIITAIRWDGYSWEYRIKNIGHEHDYQNESKLK